MIVIEISKEILFFGLGAFTVGFIWFITRDHDDEDTGSII